MEIIVSLVGLLIVAVGVAILILPKRFTDWISSQDSILRYRIAILARLIIGVLFLFAAPSARVPIVVQVIGVLALVAAAGILLIGRERVDSLLAWWLALPKSVIRAWSLPMFAFGALLIYAGA